MRRKNEKRKKYGFLSVKIPLSEISVLKVSVPLDDFHFKVSLPITAYSEAPVTSAAELLRRVDNASILPKGNS